MNEAIYQRKPEQFLAAQFLPPHQIPEGVRIIIEGVAGPHGTLGGIMTPDGEKLVRNTNWVLTNERGGRKVLDNVTFQNEFFKVENITP